MRDERSRGRIGIFGGTFDPPHIGHLIVAQDVWERVGLDRLIFIPAAVPPHKGGTTISPAPLRLEMLEAAVGDDPRFEVSDLELHRRGPSYTVDTLRELGGRYPDAELYFILGVDQYLGFPAWRAPEEIVRRARLLVMTRDGERPEVDDDRFPYQLVEVTRIDLSATEIRRRIGVGESVRYLVPAPVLEVIERAGLYQDRERIGHDAGHRV